MNNTTKTLADGRTEPADSSAASDRDVVRRAAAECGAHNAACGALECQPDPNVHRSPDRGCAPKGDL